MKRTGGGNGQTNIVLFWWSLGGVLGGITGFVLWLVFNDSMYMSMGYTFGILIGSVIGLVCKIVEDKYKKHDQQKENNMKRPGAGNKQIDTIPFLWVLVWE